MNQSTDELELIEEAAHWLDQLDHGQVPAARRGEFAAWLRESPDHVAEFLTVSALCAELSGQAGQASGADERAAGPGNVTRLDERAAARNRSRRKETLGSRPAVRWLLSAVATLVVAVGGGLFWSFGGNFTHELVTGADEQRIFVLPDGSTLELNRNSKVRVSINDAAREAQLVHGQLLLEAADDPARPFRVSTSGATVQSTDNSLFQIHAVAEATEVTVLQGHVDVDWVVAAVRADDRTPAVTRGGIQLGEGVSFIVAHYLSVPEPFMADVKAATAWSMRPAFRQQLAPTRRDSESPGAI